MFLKLSGLLIVKSIYMFNKVKIYSRIESLSVTEVNLSTSVAKEVAFHMTDWLNDLAAYVEFCSNPDQYTDEEVADLLLSFLQHVPNHLAAASKLYTNFPVTDVFDVGSVEL